MSEFAYELRTIRTIADLTSLVQDLGFLPFFQNHIHGFSIDEATPLEVWEEYLGLGPWLWRDEIAADKECIYGKFFGKKTGYVSADWFPYLANYRRDGYDFDARYDDGLARYDDKRIYEIIEKLGPITSKDLRKEAGVDSKKASAFEGILTRLQMQTYVVPVDFIFSRDPDGNKKYSYGTTVYDLPERWLGIELVTSQYSADPLDSFEKMVSHMMSELPDIDRESVEKLLK